MGQIKPDFILDTNILIYFFAGRLSELLPDKVLGFSVITEMEILSYHQLSQKDEQQVRKILSTMQNVSLTQDVKEEAIKLRKEYRIKLPDAIISATSIVNDAILLTNDKQLLKIPGLQSKSLNKK